MTIPALPKNALTEFTARGWTIIQTSTPIDTSTPLSEDSEQNEMPQKRAETRTLSPKTHMAIEKTFTFKNFKAIDSFLKHLTETILSLNHHPDIHFKPAQKTCTLTLTTHCAGNTLSDRDLVFVKTLEKVQ